MPPRKPDAPAQLGLFGELPRPSARRSETDDEGHGSPVDPKAAMHTAVDPAAAARLEHEHEECKAIAARLPERVHFGTSSWSFPGWTGLVWSRRRSASWLGRHGLAEYARHPLLTTVGIDRGFYAPIPPADLAHYASQLPEGFRCIVKATQAVTSPFVEGAPGKPRAPTPTT